MDGSPSNYIFVIILHALTRVIFFLLVKHKRRYLKNLSAVFVCTIIVQQFQAPKGQQLKQLKLNNNLNFALFIIQSDHIPSDDLD